MARRESIVPLTPERLPDFERLFGERGACGGCWCMAWRLSAREFAAKKGAGNRAAMRARVKRGPPPGLLAYRDGEPVGWVAVAPRAEYPRLAGSRVLAPVDDQPVWSITCFFLRKDARRHGLSARLAAAAAKFAHAQGARIVEGYPHVPRQAAMPDVFAWTGVASAFEKAGFVEVARRSPTRPILRHSRRP